LINLTTFTHQIIYEKTSFESRYMNLDTTLLIPWFGFYDEMKIKDTLAGFNAAVPTKDDLPLLDISYDNSILKPLFKQIFDINDCLPFTPGFLTGDNSEILYTYQSAYPNSSTLQGMACGVLNKHFVSSIYTFSFHLWGMEPEGAKKLIDYIMDDLIGNPDEQPQTLPDNIYLAQNYPNPFNATTKIKYELSHSAKVTLEIYNILGQSVTKIVSDKQQLPGFYFVEWNSTDKDGQQLASGIYFYRLQVDNETITKKMMLLK
ncbi:MAG: T9SS type A sorting domain-containing protein, partial [Candidatus Zixiibacteriota bacterium]